MLSQLKRDQGIGGTLLIKARIDITQKLNIDTANSRKQDVKRQIGI